MVSISSSKSIQERTYNHCNYIKNWDLTNNNNLFVEINDFLKTEYNLIPEKERIGKGIVYISKYVAKEIFNYLKSDKAVEEEYFIKFVQKAFNSGEIDKNTNLQQFSLLFLSEYILTFPKSFDKVSFLIEKYANHEDWTIRESTVFSIISVLKKRPKGTLYCLNKWAISENENLRRLVAESLRPRSEIKWMRDSKKNNDVLEILTALNKDPSIYVRKAVGNNIKDLSKYMPEKILDLMEKWITDSKIKVHNELATEIGLNQNEKRLIWIIKQGMRWIKEKNPEYRFRLEKILGKNYVLYFNEKRNRLAKPFNEI